MSKSVEKRVGYFILIACFIALFFINEAEAVQTNCSNSNSSTVFKYRVPIYNITNTSNYVAIDYASCNVTIYKKQLEVDNVMNSSLMVNQNTGNYDCLIGRDFPTGKFNTFYQCTVANATLQNYGRFEIVPDDVPLAIIGFLVGVSALFIIYAVKLDDKFWMIKLLMTLMTLLIYFVIFVILFPLISEEGASTGLVEFADNLFTIYAYIFSFLVFMFVIRFIIQIISMFMESKKEKGRKGVYFDD